MDKENRKLESKLIKLPEYSNNFVAETQGVLYAVRYIKTQEVQKTYQILTDSLSTLKGLQNSHNTKYFIQQIRLELANAIKNYKVLLTHVRGHQGNIGNDTADELAKQAGRYGEEQAVPLAKQVIKRHLKIKTLDRWNEIWNREGKEPKAYEWIKNVKQIPFHFPLDYYATQAISEHGRFNFYFQRFKISQESQCKCGQVASSFDHYQDNCSITEDEREELSKKYKTQLSRAKQEIIKNNEAVRILQKMVKNINDQIART